MWRSDLFDFPPVFLLVAVCLVYIVLGRLICTERTRIGLLKAFGYSNWAVGGHHIRLALVMAVLATVMGAIAGIWMGQRDDPPLCPVLPLPVP